MVRYVHLPAQAVDTKLLEDATRSGMWPWLVFDDGRGRRRLDGGVGAARVWRGWESVLRDWALGAIETES